MNAPVLVERDHSSLLIAWDAVHEAVSYELQMSSSSSSTAESEEEAQWTTLSASLKSVSVRKKNLAQGAPHRFRVRYTAKDGQTSRWSAASEALYVLSSSVNTLSPPELVSHNGGSVTLRWQEAQGATGYHLRYREEAQPAQWQTVGGLLKSNAAKKNGLDPRKAYFFAVMPVFSASETETETETQTEREGEGETPSLWAYSLSAGPFKPATLSAALAQLLPAQLRCRPARAAAQSISTAEALAGKHVAFYFSAHWCGPCRNFTPRLAELYQQVKAQNKSLEVVFVSADHDEAGFQSYYASMPWLAVDFEDDKREQLMAQFKVQGIPRLCVLAPSGRVIEDNAASRMLSLRDVDQWLQSA